MVRWIKPHSMKAGLPPGTLIHIGNGHEASAVIDIIDYTPDRCDEMRLDTIDALGPYRKSESVTWINIAGVHDTSAVEGLGKVFDLHGLTLEDIVNTGQRPKLEEYDDYLFLVLKMLQLDSEQRVEIEQVSLILLPGAVVTFQEKVGDVFETVRERIRQSKGRIRKAGADYLAYALVDAIVDNYFTIIETLSDRVEALEALVQADDDKSIPRRLQSLRTEMILLKKPLWPLRELVASLRRCESPLLGVEVRPYLEDVCDHTYRILDSVEVIREMIASLRDTYLANVSNRMNEVMKVLTVIATIFIPITFIAGIYGMNFENMPELKWPHGYQLALGAMGAVVLGMVGYFRAKKWI